MANKFLNFPGPKKGKGRLVIKRPASKKTASWTRTPYVRGPRDVPARGVRTEQAHWQRTVPELLGASDTKIVKMLIDDKMLPNWAGRRCPKCNKGILSSLKMHSNESRPKYRCGRKDCQQRVHPQHLHPLFQACRGPEALSLQLQAALLLLLLLRVSLASIHLILGVNHKVIETMQKHLEQIRKNHVVKTEKSIVFGASMKWADVEGDEATFDKKDISSDPTWTKAAQDGRSLLWEQWSGLLQRGKPKTLVLSRLNPGLTVTHAPGPGAITKHDWTPLGQKWLANRKVIFHTDAAKAYKMKLPGVLHDSVVHQQKRVKKHGKWRWTKPNFVKMKTHKLPGGKSTKVKCGTQLIDRCWKFIKERLAKNSNSRAGTQTLHRKIRAAQYEYWRRGEDMWACTGELLRDYMSDIVGEP
eukprot:Skav220205  [mRNA]  locus=scaffold2858:132927:134168:+ [translate_table: standard]